MPDLASTTSLHSSSSNSVYTTTSSSTQWGPGALAGKAILAVGKAVLRGAEYLVISRRLSAIKAIMPCLDDNLSQSWSLQRIFEDLLELSRPGLYPEAVRVQAMRMILVQIATQKTHHLCLCISQWDVTHAELVNFVSEIVAVVLFSKRGFPDHRLGAYAAALPKGSHPWSPCIRFMAEVAQLNDTTFHAVLEARFLETIIWVAGSLQARKYDQALESECNAAFLVLSVPPSYDLSTLWMEQALKMFQDEPPTSLRQLVDTITVQRAWSVVERRLLETHLLVMIKVSMPSIPDGERFFPVGWQSFEIDYWDGRMRPRFTSQRLSLSDAPASSRIAMRNFLRYVGMGGDVQDETVDYISQLSYPRKVVALAHMIGELISQSSINYSIVEKPLALFIQDMAKNIVQFLISLLQLAGDAMLDAALLNIPPFLTTRWDDWAVYGDIYRRTHSHPGRKSRPPYRVHTAKLLREVGSSSLYAVVNQGGGTENWVYFLQPLFPKFEP
ncbi:hypothetical protein B0H17DRAFT_1063431 [Mycena rosella]|uniref:Uncharacterized protein n=1 Tax=Mycena rosella TaxID=1033263 RepID=A0AAD7DHC8_MYCRO|nr:hypothetical protein B0H17DRAFT_1063431 [Mycena rosella]